MFWRARHYVRMRWLELKLETLSTKHILKTKASLLVSRFHKTVNQARRRRKRLAKRIRRAAKNALIVSLPGVTKVQLPPPPNPQLLISNHPPSDLELALIATAIEKAETESRRWTHILDERRATGHSTRAWEMVTLHRIGQANRFASRHKSLVSPIRRLPTEILQEIFIWFAKTTVGSAAPSWRYNNTLPWVLGQICSPWRSVALNTTALWVKFPAITLKNKSKKTNMQIQYLNELLRRSKDALLDISIYSKSLGGQRHSVIDLLCRHAERWNSAYLSLPAQVLVAFQSIRSRLSALQSLTLLTPMVNTLPGPIDLFEVAPVLKKVAVARPLFGDDVILPYEQLVH
ncbi:hypothetical protein JR316_0001757 [Psilocybe cubensis]|uniref:Uncharacterized protein n=1 Tax=Psilocybe cubensis TaxID=181762 RepID=A0ACB8HA16_PSICU|nr:hypothetical protein JR316_0001757 [Psilocybe cubensis]KAH9484855.1 hypothetical protein JR316_0001757 [Psilocybe cubensis]